VKTGDIDREVARSRFPVFFKKVEDMSLLNIDKLTHSFGEKKIFVNTSIRVLPGDKMGLTGANGSGKSTLVNILSGKLLPDEGCVEWLPKVCVGCLDQYASVDAGITIHDYLRLAFAALFEAEKQLERVNSEMASCTGDTLERLVKASARLQQQLEQVGFYAVDSHISRVAAGLGIAALGLDTPIAILSGGQRAKVLLAKLLLEEPNVLLLDEPTNFLDANHIEWLGKFLRSYKGAFVLVSHDPAFLQAVTNCICDIEFCRITRYTGGYESFMRQKEQRKEEYLRNYSRQQEEIGRLQDYIARNLARASTTKMAQSRRKKLNKIERLERPKALPVPDFSFSYKPVSEQVLLEVRGLTVGYDRPLLGGIDLKLKQGEKIAVRGFNGIGKTTFLKTICGILPALGGRFSFADKAAVGYYEQDHVWGDPNGTPVQEILSAYPQLDAKDARKWLARCGLRQEHADRKLKLLSGGEQAKVKLCRLMMSPHSVLLLDEPTNHLDAAAKEALKEVLKSFQGGVVLVSHDEEFYGDIVHSVCDVEKLLAK
jgi:ATPase subunit of ABC transporter with duplicated ATPase domains